MARYSFGDDERAVRRLELVAAAYEPVSRAFVAAHVRGPVGVAVDLGCGPGFSTRLLGEVTGARTLVGVDSSPAYLEVARQTAPAGRFLTADLSGPVEGVEPADVLYARLLLAHLPDPLGAIAAWRRMLAPGGRLLIEDLERVEAPPGPLRDYEALSAATVRAAGGVMYGGAALADLGGGLVAVTVPAVLAAEIYRFNVERWATDPSVGDPVALSELAAALDGVDGGTDPVSWIVRHLVLDSG